VDGSGTDTFDGAVRGMLVVAGVLSIGLFLYLVVALLRPEWFA
jgi:K+-transporting ATPase KdpF subunit